MSKEVRITKLTEATRHKMTKCQFNYEYTAPNGLKSSGKGDFAVLEGNVENFKACIHQNLKRRLGSEVNILMPDHYNKRVAQIMADRDKAERATLTVRKTG